MTDIHTLDRESSICSACAKSLGAKQRDAVVTMWIGKCSVCGEESTTVTAVRDWVWPWEGRGK